MLQNIKAAIFDLDGVVVFTDKYHYLSWKRLADKNKWDFDETLNHTLRGVSRLQSLEIILAHNKITLSSADKNKLCDKKNKNYINFLKNINNDDLYPGIIEFIEKLKKQNLKIALASSSENADLVLEKLNIAGLFEVIITGKDIIKTKPDPEIFLKTAEKLYVHPYNCLVFEDAERGVQAALKANMKCIGVGDRTILPSAPDVIKEYDEINITALIETGRKKVLYKAEPWAVIQNDLNINDNEYWETIFALSNGYLGLRGSYEEEEGLLEKYSNRGTYVNGVYELEKRPEVFLYADPEYSQLLLNHYDWQIINIYIDNERFSMFAGTIHSFERKLDLRKAVLVRKIDWESPKGHRVRFCISRLVNMKHIQSGAIRYEIESDEKDLPIRIESLVKCKTNKMSSGEKAIEYIENKIVEQKYFIHNYKTPLSNINISMAVTHQLYNQKNDAVITNHKVGNHHTKYEAKFILNKGTKIIFDKHLCLMTDLDDKNINTEKEALKIIQYNLNRGYQQLFSDHKSEWEKYWRTADIQIKGNIDDQNAIRFSMFHLRQNHNKENMHSIGVSGLSGDKRRGYIYWDADVYMMPHFLYTQPELAKLFPYFRYNCLDQARVEAKNYLGKGARFPWTTINGYTNYRSIGSQHHIDADIAWAVWKYAQTTQDDDFLYKYGAEIIFETARFLSSLGSFKPNRNNKFCINFVGSPDEYAYCVDNNYYTNMLAKFNLEIGVKIYKEMKEKAGEDFSRIVKKINLKEDEIILWQKIAENMYKKYNKEHRIYEQDDQFLDRDPVDISYWPNNYEFKHDLPFDKLRRMQVAKQADVLLLLLLLGDKYTKEEKKLNYDFYIKRTKHASSLSPGIHCIMAAQIGYEEEMYKLLRHTLFLDLFNLKLNTQEGLHLACTGGSWMAMINGIGGMSNYGDKLIFAPKIPKNWDSYTYKIKFREALLEVNVEKTSIHFQLLEGKRIEFQCYDEKILLTEKNKLVTCGGEGLV